MRILAIMHEADAGPGVFSHAAKTAGAELDAWMLPREGASARDPHAYDAVISLGGAMHVDQEREHPWLTAEKAMLAALLERGTPLLGVCLGAQLLAEAAGGAVHRAREPEIGWYPVEVAGEASDDALVGPLAPHFEALEWHSYEFLLPPGAVPLARSDRCLQSFRLGGVGWGIQFHAEVALEDFEAWLVEYRSDRDAAAIDPVGISLRTRSRIAAWNQLGRDLFSRFIDAAARAAE